MASPECLNAMNKRSRVATVKWLAQSGVTIRGSGEGAKKAPEGPHSAIRRLNGAAAAPLLG